MAVAVRVGGEVVAVRVCGEVVAVRETGLGSRRVVSVTGVLSSGLYGSDVEKMRGSNTEKYTCEFL